MKKPKNCPYCGSERFTDAGNGGFVCKDCWCFFDEEDIKREDLRHRISPILSANYATEQNPLRCNIKIGEGDAVGLSSLDLPVVEGCFLCNDGTIWFYIYRYQEPMNFDDIPIEDLEVIYRELL